MIKLMCLNNVIMVTTSIDESIVCMDTERSFVNVRRSSSTQFTLSLNEYHGIVSVFPLYNIDRYVSHEMH